MTLDADAARVLELVKLSGNPPFEDLEPQAAREFYRSGRKVLAPDPMPVSEASDLACPGPHGDIPLRCYRPLVANPAERLPVLVFFHGGGWVIGDLDTHDGVCRHLANAGGCAVVAVDYRMGPENRFPAAVDDCFAATRWVVENAGALRVDASRLAVGGDSAGGNLSAVISLLARDAGAPNIGLQLLLYPATDLGMDSESQRQRADGYLLTERNQRWFHSHYLTGAGDRADFRASPLRAASLAGLPPAYVLTCGYDPLCDEGEAYARRLVESGVRVTSHRFPGQVHGFLTMGRMIRAAGDALDEVGTVIRASL